MTPGTATVAQAAGIVQATGTVQASALVRVDSTSDRVVLVLVVAAIAVLAVAVNLAGGLGHGAGVLRASARALVQLLLVALVVAAVLGSLPLTFAFLALMSVVASGTAARRLTQTGSGAFAALPITAGSLPTVALLVASGLVPMTGTALVPIGGILIGASMTGTVLAGRRALDALRTRHGEYEAGLAIGLPAREAALLVARDDAALALVPGLDQTRTVGLVTLPGTFVGMLLGGATPAQAAAVQLVVLVALLLVQSVAAVLVLELIAQGRLRP